MNAASREKPLPGLEALDAGAGPALPLTDAEARALVAGVLARAQLPAIQRHAPRRWRSPRVIVAVLAMTTAAAAYRGEWAVRWVLAPARDEPVEPSAAASDVRQRDAAPSPRRAPLVSEPPRPERPQPTERAEPEAEPLALAPAEAAGSSHEQPLKRVRRAERSVKQPAVSGRAMAPVDAAPREPAEVAAAPRSTTEAFDTLARASDARRTRRYAEARALYSRVVERYPDSLQAQAARVAAAALSLEHLGDVAEARRLYTEAAARGGELGAEARLGLAQVHRAEGDRRGERAALREVLRAHPQHPMARAARARLQELER